MKSNLWKSILPRLAVILVLLAGVPLMIGFLSRRPSNLGVKDGMLAPCPDSPNCVCTFDSDQQHGIAPIDFTGTTAEAMGRLKKALATYPRNQIITENKNYLHVEFTTLILRYVDDVEFLIDEVEHKIHFRSASRLGHSDLGLNRSRMEAIRKAFASPA